MYSEDGDRHYISSDSLRNLYKTDGLECVVYREKGYRKTDHDIHLHPLNNGKYEPVQLSIWNSFYNLTQKW